MTSPRLRASSTVTKALFEDEKARRVSAIDNFIDLNDSKDSSVKLAIDLANAEQARRVADLNLSYSQKSADILSVVEAEEIQDTNSSIENDDILRMGSKKIKILDNLIQVDETSSNVERNENMSISKKLISITSSKSNYLPFDASDNTLSADSEISAVSDDIIQKEESEERLRNINLINQLIISDRNSSIESEKLRYQEDLEIRKRNTEFAAKLYAQEQVLIFCFDYSYMIG